MPKLPAELLHLIVVFQPLFTKPVWEHAKILLLGVLLARGKRTVTSSLRAVGLINEKHFQNYHRVLNRAQWDALAASRTLLNLIIRLLPASSPLFLSAEDTIERRRGRKIKALGYWRDPIRSTPKRRVNCYGLKWLALAVCVRLPWSRRVWALPFLTALCPGKQKGQGPKLWPTRRRRSGGGKQSRARGKARAKNSEAVSPATPRQYETAIDRLMILARLLHRWQPGRLLVLSVDGAYAAVKLALVCARTPNLELVTRLRWDAALYHRPEQPPPGKPGCKPLKGARQRSLKAWAARCDTPWEEVEVDWYGGGRKPMLVFSRTALWHTEAERPVPLRFVITRDPEGKYGDEVLASTKLDAAPAQIVEWFVARWSLEVTFEEAREYLGLETQRQSSDLAIGRTTPCLLGLFALLVLLTARLQADGQVPIQRAAWYAKPEATFSDCVALVRKHLWRSFNYPGSPARAGAVHLSAQAWEHILFCLAA